ncbi:MAG TPA: acyl-CoA dehydrogenase [Kofleriaceae bacterium]|nr:acyl-CoA dehydrogenase [Kofleriaceae bacterium]
MTAPSTNPLVDDRDVELILDEVLDLDRLLRLPWFADHDRETCQMLIAAARDLAREALFPAYRMLDAEPPRLVDGRVVVHPRMRDLYARMIDLGIVAAPRPHDVGGAQVPLAAFALATAYLMAGNLSAYGYLGLTQGAALLLEVFGDEALRTSYMARMYSGEWTGTMALTEPHAGSSLADITTTADPTPDGHYLIRGSKIFISGGDQDITENVVHMTLARIRGAPAGMKGVSLFCIPKRRLEGGALVDNDVAVAGVIHKIGWRGLPSLALSYGERGDCRGWLVGEPHQGIRYMFQMMNEARIMVGLNAVSTASVAYHEAVAYARVRTQGRPVTAKDPAMPPVPIAQHADVRRMLLRQKAIVEGGLVLIARVSYYSDLAHHAPEAAERERAGLLVDLLTPVAKSFPAERGFEANALAIQIHGGYGYSSEYLPEAWLRDQKLNSIHEGTTGIQALDLLGRRAVAKGGAPLVALGGEVAAACARARAAGVDAAWIAALERAVGVIGGLTSELAGRALAGAADAMLLHATDYLDLFSTVVIAWQWLELAAVAREALAGPLPRGRAARDAGYYRAKLAAAQYWIRTELPRIDHLAALCRDGEDSYAQLDPDWL